MNIMDLLKRTIWQAAGFLRQCACMLNPTEWVGEVIITFHDACADVVKALKGGSTLKAQPVLVKAQKLDVQQMRQGGIKMTRFPYSNSKNVLWTVTLAVLLTAIVASPAAAQERGRILLTTEQQYQNLIKNASFEAASANGTLPDGFEALAISGATGDVARDAAQAKFGNYSVKVEQSNTTGSYAVKYAAAISGFGDTTPVTADVTATDTWQRLTLPSDNGYSASVWVYIPSTNTPTQVSFDCDESDNLYISVSASSTGDYCLVDGIQVTEGPLDPYFTPSQIVDSGTQTMYGALTVQETSPGTGGDLTVEGDLTVNGAITGIEVEDLPEHASTHIGQGSDAIYWPELDAGEGDTTTIADTFVNDDAGEIDSTADFNFASLTKITNLDADALDGQNITAFLRTNASSAVATGNTLNIDSGATLSLDGAWDIAGTQILPDGSEINVLDGGIDVAELNGDGDEIITGINTGTTGTIDVARLAAEVLTSTEGDAAYVNEGQADSITSGMIVDGTIAAADLGAGAIIKDKLLELRPHAQSTPDDTLYVEAGRVIIDTTPVNFAGGSTVSFNSVTADSRIDLVTLDSSGNLGVVEGTQAASPSAPAYPLDKIVIAEVLIDETGTVTIDSGDVTDARPFLNLGNDPSGTQLDTFTLDNDASVAADATLGFGATGQTLMWDQSENRFRFSGGLYVDGTMEATNLVGATSSSGTENPTYKVNVGYAGTEPENGSGFMIEGGSGTDLTLLYDDTTNALDITGLDHLNLPAGTTVTIDDADLNFSHLAGQVADNQIADSAIQGGTGGEIEDGTITAADLGTDSVDTDEIAADAVTASEIATDAVGADEILANAVGSSELADDAVDTAAIQNLAVTEAKIAGDAVTAAKIAADAVGSSEIAADAVGSSEIAADAVGSSELADDAVDTAAIQNLAVTEAKIAGDAVTAAKIAADAVGSSEIATDAVGADEIVADAVGSSELADNAVDTAAIQALAVTNAKLAADAVTSAKILDGTIAADDLGLGAVLKEKLNELRPHPQSTPDNTLYIEAGIVALQDNTKVEYAGGSTLTFTAISVGGNSRIDLVTLNSSGSLVIVEGTEAASPSAPTYPVDKLVLAEVTIDETSGVTIDTADVKDVRPFLSLGGNTLGSLDARYVNVEGEQTMEGPLHITSTGTALDVSNDAGIGGNLSVTGDIDASSLSLSDANANSLTLGGATAEGGNIVVYRDGAGNQQFFLDADAASGDDAMTLYGGLNITDGDLTVGGNDIKSSTGTALTLSGTDVTVAGDLAVTGDNIDANAALVLNATTADEVRVGSGTGTTATGAGDLYVTDTLEVGVGVALPDDSVSMDDIDWNAGNILITPDYPNVSLYGDGTNNSGTLSIKSTGSPDWKNYYEWEAKSSPMQDYVILIRQKLPPDFSGWAASNAITVSYKTDDANATNNKVDITIYKAGVAAVQASDLGKASTTWADSAIDDSDLNSGTTWAAGEILVLEIKLYSKNKNAALVSDVEFNYAR